MATLNVDMLTGRSCELVEELGRRRVDFCAAADESQNHHCCRNNRLRTIVSVKCFDDRLMKVIVAAGKRLHHFFCALAPHIGRSGQAEDEFWSLLDENTAVVPPKDVIVFAGYLNGNVGATKNEYSCQARFGCGQSNADGERILAYAKSHNLTIVSTVFRGDSHLISFYNR
ncbi:unnamed protein product [Heligmosomoides polygyrus]|uniref:Craniofacial development protein 2-like n=1 Tax=Heligmosomoides polygyrus TaxID=6339 RepID=A0A183FUL3_HELPZ|nr:unnamed protein product [Heligmosomoides polygyrus]